MNDGTNSQTPQQPPATTSPVREVLDWLDGKKTHLVTAAAVLYLIGTNAGWWGFDERVLAIFGFSGLSALRSGVAKTQP